MSLTNAPAIITQLATQLAACAAWTEGLERIYYPELDADQSYYPAAVLSDPVRTITPYAAGAAGLQGGVLEIVIHSTDDIGTLEALGRTILEQLLTPRAGIAFNPSECSLCSVPSDDMVAGDSGIREIQISLTYGLKA